ncbi:cyclic nucleotide-binding domain-containing protein [Spirulina sp. 06S082]|uniref:cyclic nucleotide-binding domain-containing protein n=1 Tax=Spirulina sp. 06S082 TaxID=3110248 RepID=UPI002B20E52B|nr:cyclic nucleotide-binding domain-containing protein [Spirulina sp. 06S082]MEA5472106.1 cyclic nucleotide-binding domain-containing protein [Spirulina sp. 06S082]
MIEEFTLLENLSQSQLEQLESTCRKRNYKPEQFLFFEGEKQDEIYFLISGIVGLYKIDQNTQQQLKFKEMSAGQSLGEMAFVDESPRSCSVKAETEVTAYILSKQRVIDTIPEHQKILNILYLTITKQVNDHLRSLSDRHVMTLQKQIEELEERNRSGYFLFLLVFGFFLAIILAEFTDFVPDRSIAETTLFNWIYLIIVGLVPAILLFLKIDFPFRKVVNIKKNLKKSLIDGIIFSGLGVGVIFGVCVALNPVFPEAKLLDNFLTMSFAITSLFYILHSYIQEFFRAVIQTLVQRFLLDRKGYNSVILTALAFSIVHANYGFEAMMVTLIASIIFGLVYRRTYNLIGVTIVHFVLGLVYFQLSQ